ncbi:Ku protein [Cohnella suwonensis]|uniref:Ku protein n=1 Tax=Cohnella suwonensis TaxID=696072 RepID=A0ABW0LRC9_9BACL
MHAMWKGTVQIAKIQIPVKLYAATEDKELSLRQMHAVCGGSVSHLKYCQTCDAKIEPQDIRKIYDLGGGNSVEITEEELKSIAPAASKTMIIEQFANETEVDRVRLKKHYYVGTDEVGEEGFRLLQASLRQSRKVGIGYVTLRSVQSLAALWPLGDGLVLSTMLYEDEVRPMAPVYATSPTAAAKPPVPDAHLLVFNQLIAAMTSPFEGARYVNHYDVALRGLIEGKLTKLAPRTAAVSEEPALRRNAANLDDLLASLTTSLDAVKGAGGDPFAQSDFNQTH